MKNRSFGERRSELRQKVAWKLKARSVSFAGSPPLKEEVLLGHIEDIASGGICVRFDRAIEPASVVRCEIFAMRSLPGIPTILEVRWAEPRPKGVIVGLRFLV